MEFIDIKTLLSLRTMFDLVNYAADFRSEIIAGVSVLGIPPEGGVVWLQHDTNQDFGLIHHGSDAPLNGGKRYYPMRVGIIRSNLCMPGQLQLST